MGSDLNFMVWEKSEIRVKSVLFPLFFSNMKFLMIFLLLLIGQFHPADAGTKSDSLQKRSRFITGGFSAVAYKGSLQSSYSRWTPAYHFGIQLEKKKFTSSFFGFGFGSYIGEDRTYRLPSKADPTLQPSTSFVGRFFTIHYEVRFLLFRYRGFQIQAAQGIGLFRFSVWDRSGNNLGERPKTRAAGESYSQNSFFFPSSLLLQYRFPNRMSLGFQAGWFNNSSQYLDNMKDLSLNQDGDNLAGMRFHFSMPLN